MIQLISQCLLFHKAKKKGLGKEKGQGKGVDTSTLGALLSS